MSRRLLIPLIAISLMLAVGWLFLAKRERAVSPDQICLGTSSARIKNKKGFKYLAQGHGNSKTQYNAKDADKNGGHYTVECKAGKVCAIYVTYDKPMSRHICMETIERLVGQSQIIERDTTELSLGINTDPQVFNEQSEKGDALPTSEYFYFKNGNYAELQYAEPISKGVSLIIGYSGS